MSFIRTLALLLLSVLASPLAGSEAQVRLPLDAYQRLVTAPPTPRPAPAPYALVRADVSVAAREDEHGAISAAVQVELQVDVLEEQWTLVPILPAGTAVDEARAGGEPVRLLAGADGLGWATAQRGRHELSLRYRVDAQRFDGGNLLAIPLPQAASTALSATLPGSQLEVAVVPGSGVQTTYAEEGTSVTATIPATQAVQLSWRSAFATSSSISRAVYAGTLGEDAIGFAAELSVDLAAGGVVTLPLLPASVTLSDVRVDGKPAPIVVAGDRFATRLQGKGAHTVAVAFQVPVEKQSGAPRVRFEIPEIPVSRLDLTMPGRKELKVSPAAGVSHRYEKEQTVATAFVPMTGAVELSWIEAVPEAARVEKRLQATLFHAVHAEEGVLYTRVTASYEVTRGETNVLEIELPAGVQVSRVADAAGTITEWQIGGGAADQPRVLSVFLDRQLSGPFRFEIDCERPLGATPLAVPILRALHVQRQRGMVALLSSKELTLNPSDERQLTRVGENQIPADLREPIKLKVAHTFKYSEDAPRLAVTASAPERQQGKFDAQVDTLVSLADVTLRGSASVEINVKSGTLSELTIELPANANLLSLTAPSMREHGAAGAAGSAAVAAPAVTVEFTQEMEGQFRVELAYERILGDGDAQVNVPVIRVRGAEVEQGRIAVEALSAMEVQAKLADHLTALDPSELPQQLVLKTTNPILLAYKYVQAQPAPELQLAMTRHRAIEVRAATIDEAVYRTLVTADGLAVTAAELTLRNSREQFLRLRLPRGAEVWSVFVNGVAEKPARGADGEILVKIVNSAQGFPVQVVYAVPVRGMGWSGRVAGELARPDMVTTRTRWEVYLPDRFAYGRVRSNLDIAAGEEPVSGERLRAGLAAMAGGDAKVVGALRIDVPASGVRFVFTKLYASQAAEAPWFSIGYVAGAGGWAAQLTAAAGAAAFWLGVWLVLSGRRGAAALAAGAAGVAIVAVVTGYLGFGAGAALWLSVALAAAAVARSLLGLRLSQAQVG